MNNEDNIIRATGLARNSNDIVLPPGSLVAADECTINKDNVISRRRGFFKCADGLPPAKPEQLFTDGQRIYVHINDQLYFANNGTCDYTILQGQTPLLSGPFGLFLSATSILYFTSAVNLLREVDTTSKVSAALAGLYNVSGTADGVGSAARFNQPVGVWGNATDLYICDSSNSTIRRYNIATNTVSTFAGLAGTPGSADGVGAAARFRGPTFITGNATDLYVTDRLNFTIRRIDIATATVSTFAGTAAASGSADGIGAAARFRFTNGIWANATHLYVADEGNYTIRKIEIATADVTTPAGLALDPGYVDGAGVDARFRNLGGLWGNGTYLYIPDWGNFVLRRMVIATNVVDTIAGRVGDPGFADGVGTLAQFDLPFGITGDATYIYIADTSASTIRRLTIADNRVTTYVGVAGVPGNADGYLLNTIQGP